MVLFLAPPLFLAPCDSFKVNVDGSVRKDSAFRVSLEIVHLLGVILEI